MNVVDISSFIALEVNEENQDTLSKINFSKAYISIEENKLFIREGALRVEIPNYTTLGFHVKRENEDDYTIYE